MPSRFHFKQISFGNKLKSILLFDVLQHTCIPIGFSLWAELSPQSAQASKKGIVICKEHTIHKSNSSSKALKNILFCVVCISFLSFLFFLLWLSLLHITFSVFLFVFFLLLLLLLKSWMLWLAVYYEANWNSHYLAKYTEPWCNQYENGSVFNPLLSENEKEKRRQQQKNKRNENGEQVVFIRQYLMCWIVDMEKKTSRSQWHPL